MKETREEFKRRLGQGLLGPQPKCSRVDVCDGWLNADGTCRKCGKVTEVSESPTLQEVPA